jgi:hypothetical protein
MNDCRYAEIRDQLPDLLHGRLDPGARAVVEAHLAACGDCRDELALLRSLRDAAHVAPAVDVARIVAALPGAARRRALGPWSRHGWRVAVAVTIMVIGGSSLAIMVEHRSARDSASLAGGDSATGGAFAQGPDLLASEEYSELNPAELRSLLKKIPALDALPLPDPDIAVPVLMLPGDGGTQ